MVLKTSERRDKLEYIVHISKFHGPFELLFYLIEANEVDIYDIPISEIADQYLSYVDLLTGFDMEITSEFILMASTLLEIKSKMLLPQRENQEDPRAFLVNQLVEYKLFREAASRLKEQEALEARFISKPAEEIEYDGTMNEQLLFGEISAYDLLYTIKKLLKNRAIPIKEETTYVIEKDEYTVTDCIHLINEKLEKLKKLNIIEIFSVNQSKKFMIVVFLSLLEMSKLRNLKLIQDCVFGEIFIQKA
jgi:segregation and condensation protein A